MPHSAVLLAGGQSTRMGRDKAQIEFGGVPLWKHQLETLRKTLPMEVFISSAGADRFPDAGCPIVSDEVAGQGPLGGIAAALSKIATERLLVLAVDVPLMDPVFLRGFLASATEPSRGLVPVQEDGKLEPLVAIYPRSALVVAQEQLQRGDRKLALFIERLIEKGMMEKVPITRDLAPLFANWNTPEDVLGESD